MAGVFSGCQIVLDLTTSVAFKKKVEIKKKIIENGGIVSFIVTKKSTHVVGNDPEKYDISYKCQMAAKYRIPVVSPEFIWSAIKMGKLPNSDDYIIGGRSKKSDFKSGKITANLSNTAEKKKAKSLFSIKGTKVWKFGDKDAPFFDETTFEIAKYAAFQGYDKKSESHVFHVLELQAADVTSKNAENREFKFRVFTHYGSIQKIQEGNPGNQECRYAQNADVALAIYGQLHKDLSNPTRKMELVQGSLPRGIGSAKLQKMLSEMMVDDESLAPPVVDLIEHIWREAAGEVEEIIATPVSNIKVEQVEKAEAILLQIREAFDKSSEVQKLLVDFYDTLKHTSEQPQNTTVTKAWLAKKQDLCQLIKDMVSVNEATNWSTRSSVEAKYRALRCRIGHLETHDSRYKTVKHLVMSSIIGDLPIEIKSIYEVQRPIEDNSFLQEMSNKRLLFHSSKTENFVGIFSRGLLLPKIVVDDFGGTRTDAGTLGSGVYFASAASTSAKYSHPSKTKGTRLMLVNEVALGGCLDVFEYNTELKEPPEGYNSVHGVRKKHSIDSQFKDDEYVVYSLNQQRIKYLVEFALAGDTFTSINVSETETDMEDVSSGITDIDLRDVQGVEDPLSKVKAGLICDKHENAVDLRGVHIRARLVDLAAEVIVMQEYYNNLDDAVEAKFIFPLDDMAAVCGFEAFINGKHIIGEVKEKEMAHREYKKAISEGHGAYLMDRDEETPDIFTVSVGNLPPGACVLIKITYVAELQVEGEVINFRLPGSVAPWKEDSATKETTQTELDTHKVETGKTTVQVSIDMPFDIHSLECPTHKLRIKKTATKAVVKMKEGQSFKDGFQLLIGLAEIHVPRMWVENHPTKSDHQACMLTFYPEFEAGEQEEVEIVFLLDLSNSMKGQALEDAKKILLLTLKNLPSHALFNIVVFGTAYRELFPVSETNTPANASRAHQFVMNCSANLGNTEVFRPLHSNYLLSSESSIKNIFLISDGHINNEDIVLNAALSHSTYTRIFTFGVSSTSNVHLLRSLARVGGGAFEFFDRKAKSKWENKVKNQLSKAAQPGLTSVSVEWRQFDEDPASLPQAPRQITALFSGSRQVVYGYVPNCTMATLKAVVGGQEVCTVVSTSDLGITRGLTVHRLTARAIIRDWEDGMLSSDRTRHEILKMNLKPYIIDLSTEYSIVTQFTSFVAVEKRDEDEKAGKWTVTGPTISELVSQEVVDMLPYMSWELDAKATKEDHYEEMISKLELSVKNCTDEKTATEIWNEVQKKLEPSDPKIIELAESIGHSLHNLGHEDKAISVCQAAFDAAVAELDTLSEESYMVKTKSLNNLAKFLSELKEMESTEESEDESEEDVYSMLDDGNMELESEDESEEESDEREESAEWLARISLFDSDKKSKRLRSRSRSRSRSRELIKTDGREEESEEVSEEEMGFSFFGGEEEPMSTEQMKMPFDISEIDESQLRLKSSLADFQWDDSSDSGSEEDEEQSSGDEVECRDRNVSFDCVTQPEKKTPLSTKQMEKSSDKILQDDLASKEDKEQSSVYTEYIADVHVADEEEDIYEDCCCMESDTVLAKPPSTKQKPSEQLNSAASRLVESKKYFMSYTSQGKSLRAPEEERRNHIQQAQRSEPSPDSAPPLPRRKGGVPLLLPRQLPLPPRQPSLPPQRLPLPPPPPVPLQGVVHSPDSVPVPSPSPSRGRVTSYLAAAPSPEVYPLPQEKELMKEPTPLLMAGNQAVESKSLPAFRRSAPSLLMKGSIQSATSRQSVQQRQQKLEDRRTPPPPPQVPTTQPMLLESLSSSQPPQLVRQLEQPLLDGWESQELEMPSPPPPMPAPMPRSWGISLGQERGLPTKQESSFTSKGEKSESLISEPAGKYMGYAKRTTDEGVTGSVSQVQHSIPSQQSLIGFRAVAKSVGLPESGSTISFGSAPKPAGPVPVCGSAAGFGLFSLTTQPPLQAQQSSIAFGSPAGPLPVCGSAAGFGLFSQTTQPTPLQAQQSSIIFGSSQQSADISNAGSATDHPAPQLARSIPTFGFVQGNMTRTAGLSMGGSAPQKKDIKKTEAPATLEHINELDLMSTPSQPQAPLEVEKFYLTPSKLVVSVESQSLNTCLALKKRRLKLSMKEESSSAVMARKPEVSTRRSRLHGGFATVEKEPAGSTSALPVGTDAFSEDLAKTYGIGVSLSTVRLATGTRLRFSGLGTLIDLQNSKGFWELNEELEKVLGFDIKSFKNILYTAGLQSLGPTVTKETIRLLATIMVLLSIYELFFPERFPLNLDAINSRWSVIKEIEKDLKKQQVDITKKLAAQNVPDSQVDRTVAALTKGLRYCEDTDNRHPLIYSTLELGPNWVSVSAKLLGVCA